MHLDGLACNGKETHFFVAVITTTGVECRCTAAAYYARYTKLEVEMLGKFAFDVGTQVVAAVCEVVDVTVLS